ncbi:MAG: methyltransferase domain-containing protein [Roseiarcus sp.]
MSAIDRCGAASSADSRWAVDPYPDYVAEVNRSIAFSGAEQSFFTRGKAKRLLEILRRRGCEPAQMRLLDIGCGVGLIHQHIAGEFAELVGADVAHDALKTARRNNPSVSYREQIGQQLPVEAGAFGAVTTVCVMHHVPPDQRPRFIAEAWAALRPSGWLMVFEHNPWNPLTRLAVARCPFDFDALLIDPVQMTRILREAGFVDVAREFLFFTPFANAFAELLEDKLRAVPAGAQYVAIGRRPG